MTDADAQTGSQSGILQSLPDAGRHFLFSLVDPSQLKRAIVHLKEQPDDGMAVVGLGRNLIDALGASVPGLRAMPAWSAPGLLAPVTEPAPALWYWLRGADRGELAHRGRRLCQGLAPGMRLDRIVETFRYGRGPNGHGRDLTGYEDGTENPQGADAARAALVAGAGVGLDGSSYAALQRWQHDFDAFEALAAQARDLAVGRRLSDNEELDDAPESAHVKRTAQESFDPEAFVLRRSMPWARDLDAGLMFLAFGKSLDAFEAQWRRMTGREDGVADALFGFSRPLDGAYFWCPPVQGGGLDLRWLSR